MRLSIRPIINPFLQTRALTSWLEQDKVLDQIRSYPNSEPCPQTIQTFFGMCKSPIKIDDICQFVKTEIPCRLSGMINEIDALPESMRKNATLSEINLLYCRTFDRFRKLILPQDPSDRTGLKKFFDTVTSTLELHRNVKQNLAIGMMECKRANGLVNQNENIVQTFMDRFLLSRISVRMILNISYDAYNVFCIERVVGCDDGTQATAEAEKPPPRLAPYIDANLCIKDVAETAYSEAASVYETQYRYSVPSLNIIEENFLKPGKSVTLKYPPSHLRFILFELLKNAMRATVDHCDLLVQERLGVKGFVDALDKGKGLEYQDQVDNELSTRPIEVTIYESNEDITVCASDKGEGIPFSRQRYLFKYLYTTMEESCLADNSSWNSPGSSGSVPMAGFGCGLAFSRLYARYFQGDLKMSSVESVGTTAYLYLKTDAEKAKEILPVFTPWTHEMYEARSYNSQWTSGKK